jgi:hypothetical protein
MENIMSILYITNKRNHVTTVEKFYVYRQTKNGTQINDKSTVSENKLFDIILLHELPWSTLGFLYWSCKHHMRMCER